ncbi:MAG: insulinase family protein [Proteobacteria bacterium]|nr:insulinase family protein [Pseudomonadota bacterium]
MPRSSSATPLLPQLETRLFTLGNGLELLVHEDWSAPVASIQAWVRTGSIHEGQQLGSGISHLLEHMAFQGTEKRSGGALAQQIQDVGGYVNAYTSFDRTVYWVDLPSKGVPVVLDLISDAVFRSTLPPEEFAKEQDVIRREFAMGFDDPDRMQSERLFSTAYQLHPYRQPVIGHLEVFNALSREDVLDYYRRRYAPNNVFFVVTGAVRAEEVAEQLAKCVVDVPRLALAPVWVPGEPVQMAPREVHEEFDTELTRLSLAWHVPNGLHPDAPALDLLAAILGEGRSARLYRALREKRGIVHSVGAWTYCPSDGGLFGLSAVLDVENRDVVQAALLEELREIQERGVQADEMARIRKMRLSGYLGSLSTARGRASDIGDSWMSCRNTDFSRIYGELLAKVEPEEIQRVARHYIQAKGLNVVSLNPKGSGRKAVPAGSVSVRGAVEKNCLENGLRTLICRDERLPLVSLSVGFRAGRLVETGETNGISKLFSRVLLKGTSARSAEVIADTLESLGGGIGADAGKGTVTVGVSVLRDDLESGLEILADVVRHAIFPKEALERERTVQLAAIRSEREDPFTVAGQLLRSHLMEGHPDGLPAYGTLESVGAIRREDLLAFRDRYCVGRNGVLSIFGDVDPVQAHALVERYFGGLAEGEEALKQPPLPSPLCGIKFVETSVDRQQTVLMVGYRCPDIFHEDQAALCLLEEACSDLGGRMFVRIREELGLAYSVGSSHYAGLSCGSFVFYVATDPEKQEAVLSELNKEIRALAQDGLGEAELCRAKEKFLGGMDLRNQSLAAFGAGCLADELLGLGAEHFRQERTAVESVTAAHLRAVASRIFGEQPFVTAKVGPVSGAKSA